MTNKYTPASALAIKHDVQHSQSILAFILDEIDIKKKELFVKQREVVALDSVLSKKRSLIERFEDKMMSVFQKEHKKADSIVARTAFLEEAISKLELAKDLLNTQIKLQKEEIAEPRSAIFVASVIEQLGHTLDKLLVQIDASETDLEEIELQKKNLIAGNKNLQTDRVKQEGKVRIAMKKMEEIDDRREAQLKELAREKNKLTQIQNRERDSVAMAFRLTKEYRDVYDSLPRRGKK